MEPKQIFLINNGLYYLDNGKYVPFSIAQPPSGGGLSKNGVIKLINQFGGGDVFESGTFTLSADGLIGTGNVNGNPISYNPLTKVMTFPTTKKLKLGFFNVKNDFDGLGSEGKDDGVIANSIRYINPAGNNIDQLNSISIPNNSVAFDGWTGLITLINNTSFNITFTQIGNGLDITGQFHLEEQ